MDYFKFNFLLRDQPESLSLDKIVLSSYTKYYHEIFLVT